MDAQQCDQCPPCSQPSCLIPEFTPECTDDCLVLACDDPDHGQQTCLVTNGSTPCDGTCMTAAACNDCTGLEEIASVSRSPIHVTSPPYQLQRCTDYHSYLAHPKAHDPLPSLWYPLLPDTSCDCPQDLHSAYPPLPHSIQALISDPSISSSASSTPSLAPFSPNLHSPSPFPIQSNPTQSFTCMWANCSAVFNSVSALIGHVNLQHLCPIDTPHDLSSTLPLQSQGDPHPLSQTPLSCHWGDCAMFPSPSSIPGSSVSSDDHVLNFLTSHLMQDHLGVSYPLPPSASLQSHLPDLHESDTVYPPPTTSDPPPHDCSGTHPCKWKECSKTFSSCDDLTAHIAAIHIGGGKAHYDCFWGDCHRHGISGFSSKQKISRHIQSHTGHRPFHCQVCNQNFSEAATLQQHMRRHTQERPYVCDFPGCRKAFSTTGALTIHKRTHNGLRPFKCKFCDRAFAESSNLTKHLRTHTGARPYTCGEEGCGKAFARPDQLARHMNVHRKKNAKG